MNAIPRNLSFPFHYSDNLTCIFTTWATWVSCEALSSLTKLSWGLVGELVGPGDRGHKLNAFIDSERRTGNIKITLY